MRFEYRGNYELMNEFQKVKLNYTKEKSRNKICRNKEVNKLEGGIRNITN